MCIFQIIYDSLIASDGLKAPKLLAKIRQPNSVVKNPAGSIVIRVGSSNYTNQRQVLTVGSSDRIENTEPPHSESNNTRADATRASVAISGVAGVELVAAANVGEPRLCDEVVEEGQVKVTGHSEDVSDADLDESASKVATQSGLGRVDHCGGDRILNSHSGAVWQAAHFVACRLANVKCSDFGVHGLSSDFDHTQNKRKMETIKIKTL